MEQIKWIFGDMHLRSLGMFNRIYSKSFASQEEYEEAIVKNWNKKVTSVDDIVIIIGDLGFKDGIEAVIPRLRGRKWLLMGNHDGYSKSYYEKFFEKVFDTPIYFSKRIVISHIPIPVEAGILNVHGHTHHVKLKSENHINVCPEWTEYKPVGIKEFEKIISRMTPPNYQFLQEWYAEIQISYSEDQREFILKEDGTINAAESLKLKLDNMTKI